MRKKQNQPVGDADYKYQRPVNGTDNTYMTLSLDVKQQPARAPKWGSALFGRMFIVTFGAEAGKLYGV